MGKIRVLSKETTEKIAAGEIIERPASILRELLDNSLDASSTSIQVEIIEGGKKGIRVQDNGEGMTEEELELCIQQYATSKIRSFDDLYRIHSMGFRGEALHAISLVCELTLSSRVPKQNLGTQIQASEGKIKEKKPHSKGIGTTIEAYHLFHNFPVRRMHMKSDRSESYQSKEVFLQKAIPFYDREFEFLQDHKTLWKLLACPSPLQRINQIYKELKMQEQVIEIQRDYEDFQIRAYVSKPNSYQSSKKFQLHFLNQRCITSPALYHVISKAYEDILPIGKYPIAFLFMEVHPRLLDINVHPTKKEIRIHIESALYKTLSQLIQENIQENFFIPKLKMYSAEGEKQKEPEQKEETNQFESPKERVKDALEDFYHSTSHKRNLKNLNKTQKSELEKKETKQNSKDEFLSQSQFSSSEDRSQNFSKNLLSSESSSSSHDKILFKNSFDDSDYRILGTLFETYLVIERDEELLLLDQHAAHERLRYEKIKSQIQNDIPCQKLLEPFILNLSFGELEKLIPSLADFSRLGFEWVELGRDSLAVDGIPYFLNLKQAKERIDQLIDTVRQDKGVPTPIEFLTESMKMQACRSAIQSGDRMSETELRELLQELEKYPNPFACPHGRPTALKLNQRELEALFLRRT